MMASRFLGGVRKLVASAVAAVIVASTGATVSIGQQPGGGVWEVIAAPPGAVPRMALSGQFAVARLNRAVFTALVQNAPAEGDATAANTPVITIPMPDGSLGTFTVMDSPIIAPELAAAFPAIRTFTGQGTSDPTATTRFGWTDLGFHAIVVSASGTTYVEPYDAAGSDLYVSVRKADAPRPRDPFICTFEGAPGIRRPLNEFPIAHGTLLHTYRLAIAATGEYTTAAGGTVPAAVSRIVATMNRVNGIYEREIAVRMTVATGTVGSPTALVFTDPVTDGYTNNDGGAMLGENQTKLDTVIGSGNYDIGHVFSTGGGGIAALGSVCNAGVKAQGVTGSPTPTGDAFDVDYVAHEMGHQFGGNHTFNGTSNNCGFGNRSAAHATEVGSGSTIQAYAGICDVEDLQLHSDDYFTLESLNELTAFITSAEGSTCGTLTATGNTVPTVSAGVGYNIPISTPFTLTATGSDANGDALTFDWEQYSFGTASNSVLSASTDDGTRPIMRSYSPTTSPSRTIPKLSYILNNANVPPQTHNCSGFSCLTGEILPTTSRAMQFRVTARDNRAGGGAIATPQAITLVSTTAAGPFVVTAPNTAVTLTGGAPTTVTWNVAGTSVVPVNVLNVRILLSADGGNSFPTVLTASTPNDGSETLIIPGFGTTTARIKVEAVGNIFFDISNTNFSVTAQPPPTFTDTPLVVGTTVIKSLHFTEVRDAINAARIRYSLAAMGWTGAVTAGTTIQAGPIIEMQNALIAVYTARGMMPPTFPPITPGVTIVLASHVTALRNGVLGVW